MIEHLPRESAYVRSLHPTVDWGQKEELLAFTLEHLDLTNRLLFRGFGFKGDMWKPLKVPRPSDVQVEARRQEVKASSPREGFRRLMQYAAQAQGGG